MAKHFTKRHAATGYAAMGNNPKRPRYAAVRKAGVEAGERRAASGSKAAKRKAAGK